MKKAIQWSCIACFVLMNLSACSQSDEPNETADESAAVTATSADSQASNLAAEQATAEITADYMRGLIVEISDDKYEGRGPGSRGDVAARKYLAEELEKLGLEPAAADGS